ncbi:Hypp1136 [Branchiostoma lanceolatum]|uniref:Hypp1136 protein n=1 Tax=Branchiostoma lanceolatum TaxID=7740 RepID=A0A8J9ZHD2_BRALA|nr:Hypp1136 [Branchiostoma lanceolatum]
MSDVGNTVLFYISEDDDYSPKAEAQDSDKEDSETQTLYTLDDIEKGLRQFERERHGEVTDQPKFPGSKGVEQISILEMVTKDAPVDEKLVAPPNDTDRLYTTEDILEALETEDGHLSLKDKQEKKIMISLRTEESKKTVKAMRDRCRKRMKEKERRIRKRTWRKYSLDSLNSDKMSAALSEEKQGLVKKQDDKEKLSDRLLQLDGDKQEPMTESDDKEKIVNKAAASPVHESIGDVSNSLISATHPSVDDGHKYISHAHSEYPEEKGKHGNGIRPSAPESKLAGTSSESSDVKLTTDGVPCNDERATDSDSHNHFTSEENDKAGHEQTKGKANLKPRGKVRRFFTGFRRVCRLLCCISDTGGSEE